MMLILRIIGYILLFILAALILFVMSRVIVYAELYEGFYRVKVKLFGVTVLHIYKNRHIDMLIKKAAKKTSEAVKTATEKEYREIEREEMRAARESDMSAGTDNAQILESREESEKESSQKLAENREMSTVASSKSESFEASEEGSGQAQKVQKVQKIHKEKTDTAKLELDDDKMKLAAILKIIDFAKDSLSKLSEHFLRKISVEKTEIYVSVSSPEMANVAKHSAYINAIVGTVIGKLQTYLKVRKKEIDIYPDFTKENTTYYLRLIVSLRPIHGIITGILLGLDYLKFRKGEIVNG